MNVKRNNGPADKKLLEGIGRRLASARKLLGIRNQKMVARAIGRAQSSVSAAEGGRNEPSAAHLRFFAARGINVNWILTGEPPRRLPAGLPTLIQEMETIAKQIGLEIRDADPP